MATPKPATPSANPLSSPTTVANSSYRVGKKIGEGSFGVVFEGTKLDTRTPVAIKFEPRKSDAPQLRDEYRSYRTLAPTPGIPKVYHYGSEGLHNVLVIDLLGPNLEDLFDMCGRKFSVKTVALVAKQMITRVQAVHEKSLIYRDIKPDNFLIGVPGSKTANVVHLVDFGMAKHYRDPRSKVHIPYREKKSLSGTARYMSINTHLGREQSRRDDLESIGHVLMYFLRGNLPWQGLRAATNKQKYEKIGEKKQTTAIRDLCEVFPDEFGIYLAYTRKLGFEETPDYDFLRDLFSKVLKSLGEKDDGVFDWMMLNDGKGWEGLNAQNKDLPKPAAPRQHRHRERGERDRERRSRVPVPAPAPLLDASIQPLAPPSRRMSAQQQAQQQAQQHPYANQTASAPAPAYGGSSATAQSPYTTSPGTGYGGIGVPAGYTGPVSAAAYGAQQRQIGRPTGQMVDAVDEHRKKGFFASLKCW